MAETAGAKRVQGFVLDIMVAEGYITQAQADEAAAEEIVLAPQRASRYRAPHFVYAVGARRPGGCGDENLLDRGGLRIDTTLQYNRYQRSAEKWARVAYDLDRLSDERLAARYGEAALGWIKQLQGRNINNDALVTLNYRTGAVIAYVGSANYYGRATPEHQPQFDVVGQAYRQSGSAFKPITYATGFERGVLTPATMIMDVQGEIDEGYTVPNADGGQRGPVRVRDALKYSWNIPVAKAQQMIGTENVVDMAERLGLQWDPRQEDEVAVPSLTLGTIGVHQIDLAAAYGVLANGGVRAETYLIEKITDRDGTVIYDHAQDAAEPQRILSEQAAYLVTDILADNTDPAENSIWGARFQLQTDEGRRPATLKTGTTNDFRDLQAFGFLAPDADPTVTDGALVTGVWVGNSDFSPIADVFAADGPTFIWHDYMAEVTAGGPAAARLPAAGRHRGGGGRCHERPAARRPDADDGDRDLRHLQPAERAGHAARAPPDRGRERQDLAGGLRRPARDRVRRRRGIFLDLVGWERDFQTRERANRRWIERWRGREAALGRSPARASTRGWRRPRPARRASSRPRRPRCRHRPHRARRRRRPWRRPSSPTPRHRQRPARRRALEHRDGGPVAPSSRPGRVPRTRGWSARYSRTERRRAPVPAPCTITASSSPASRASSR